ncbi:hypothetical protein EC991_001147 [Linnemannia zychae]|nr:hypothetical protein EC991_001147 [Linnemannia zychae]
MIMSCTKLRKIDWIGRTLCDTYIWTAASGSCWPNLTYLRCQIGNQFTMTQLSAIIWKRIKGVMGPFGYQETRVIVERQSVGARQTKVLQKLGSLIHLRVLDIGADFRYGVQVGDGNDGGTVVEFDETGLDERPMMHNCLKLSLDMGLGALSTLKDLEVFGFEGIEHEIDEMEIEWMAEHWPKLKVMRGLFGTLLPTTEEETKRAHLHSIMRDLRPDVIHEASDVCLMVPLA